MTDMDRRGFLAAMTASMSALSGCGGSPGNRGGSTTEGKPTSSTGERADDEQTTDTTATGLDGAPEAVSLETVADGFTIPLDMAVDPTSDRIFVVEQRGLVHVLDAGTIRRTPLLDVRNAITQSYEAGLLGIALHPEFEDNGQLFLRYSAPPRPGTPSGYNHTFVLSEFELTDDRQEISPESERTLLEIPEPQSNHNAGSIVFGPDGYLYVGVGDGGAGGDRGTGHVEDWYDAVRGGNGQDVTDNLLGSILRIDVDDSDGEKPYAIPDSNPLVGRDGLDEHYAWGFRNPWRLAFDGDDLYAGDVGQAKYEEIDLVRAGGNYGWNVMEGTHCYGATGCPDRTPESIRGGEPLHPPVIEYPHTGAAVRGISVITGNVYKGSEPPGLSGLFVFGDYQANGKLFVADPSADGLWQTAVLPVETGDAAKLGQLFSLYRHGEEFYVLGSGADGGGVYRLA
jgi:glucose/arabinose dehydrogenase